MSCQKEFLVNTAYICPKCGTVTFFTFGQMQFYHFMTKNWGWIFITAIGIIAWGMIVVLKDSDNWELALINVFSTWQGIVGIILALLGIGMEKIGHPQCSNCQTLDGLIDLNCPMGQKLYRDVHCKDLI